MANAQALTLEAFATRLDALNPPKTLALALSGGRDSVALLRLCADYARTKDLALQAFTVDHGLRPSSAAEARQAAEWAQSAGVPHRILNWTGEKPTSGVQAAARAERYRLLIHAATDAGCEALLTAHSLDDQAETLFMRLARGAGVNGLAAMREESLVASGGATPIRLLRPLLSFSRQAVTAWLDDAGCSFIDDPSNDDPAYERVRVRGLLAALGEQDLLTATALGDAAARMRAAADCMQAQEDDLFHRLGGCFYGWGGISVDHWRADAPGADGLARRLIHAAGGGEFAPEAAAAATATKRALEAGADTLSGTLIRRSEGRLWFLREPAALLGRAGVARAKAVALIGPVLWDRRFIISPRGAAGEVEIASLGDGARGFLGHKTGLFPGPVEALAALPGLYHQGVLIGAPALPFMGHAPATAISLAEERYQGRIVRF